MIRVMVVGLLVRVRMVAERVCVHLDPLGTGQHQAAQQRRDGQRAGRPGQPALQSRAEEGQAHAISMPQSAGVLNRRPACAALPTSG